MEPELGAFLRAQREKLTPQQCGLPPGRRRRTPGLRREELSEISGLSTTWISWLEQGRPVRASTDALGRLADALQLDEAERSYLFNLAGQTNPDPVPTKEGWPEGLKSIIHQFDDPCYVLDGAWNAILWNRPAEELFASWLGNEANERNQLLWLFRNSNAREIIMGWEERARRVVSEFRADCVARLEQPEIKRLLAKLSDQAPDFDRFWSNRSVRVRDGGERLFNHPKLGNLSLTQVTLTPVNYPSLKVVILTKKAQPTSE